MSRRIGPNALPVVLMVGGLAVWAALGLLFAREWFGRWMSLGVLFGLVGAMSDLGEAIANTWVTAKEDADPVARLPTKTGVVIRALDPVGQTRFGAEIWAARSAWGETIEEGVEVRVIEREGLELTVEPL